MANLRSMLFRMKYYVQPKRLLFITLGLVAIIAVIVIVAVAVNNKKDAEQGPIADRVVANLDKENIRENMIYFSKEPHPAGGARNLELGAEILKRWKSYGFDDVFENDYQVLLSLPTEESYIKYGETKYQPKNNEGSNVIPPYNAFAKNGKVTGELVYVNYGRVEDFVQLHELGIDMVGKIALCRYGKIFRGSKAQNAFEREMIGMILYSDPEDTGTGKGKVYPDGQWLPDTGVQRGNVKSVKGDISTHLYPSYEGAYHASGEELAKIAPKIPVIPIPFNTAKPLHALIGAGGVETPDNWGQYNLGPSVQTIELNVKTNDTLKLCRNIIGVINGSVEPDRWVLIGVHRDAWIRGASDPVSGMSTILEISRSLGEQVRDGWRPRRTIIFASWDAEEPGILGSYEFVEDYITELKHNAVAYINMDTAVNNPHMLNMKSTPNMFSLLYDAASKTESPETDYDNLYEFWIAAERTHNNKEYTKPPINLIGSGSDYTAFLNEVGISCIDFAYKTNYGTYPVYHTQYDTYEWMNKYGDPEFIYHRQLGAFATRVLLSLANELILPLSVTDYANKIKDLTSELIIKNADTLMELDLEILGMLKLSNTFFESASDFSELIKKESENITEEDVFRARELNDKLMYIDRQFIYLHGLPNRPSFRHLIFAPSSTNTYAGSAFPGIGDEIAKDIKDKANIQKQIGLVTSKLEAVNRVVDTESEFI